MDESIGLRQPTFLAYFNIVMNAQRDSRGVLRITLPKLTTSSSQLDGLMKSVMRQIREIEDSIHDENGRRESFLLRRLKFSRNAMQNYKENPFRAIKSLQKYRDVLENVILSGISG